MCELHILGRNRPCKIIATFTSYILTHQLNPEWANYLKGEILEHHQWSSYSLLQYSVELLHHVLNFTCNR